MKFCPVIPEVCRGQVHGPRKERRKRRRRRRRIIIIIIIRNGAKTISLPNFVCLGDLITTTNINQMHEVEYNTFNGAQSHS
jgi:hypothetical protein